MNIPSEFNGYVTFVFDVKSSYLSISMHDRPDNCIWKNAEEDGRIIVSDPIALNVALFDIREKQIAALEKQIEQERAESQFRINQMLGKIQELQAVEVQK